MPLQPHTPGQPYNPAIHGVVIEAGHLANARYDTDGYYFAAFAESAGIPTGVTIPKLAHTLISQAYAAQDENRDALAAEARAVIAADLPEQIMRRAA